MEEENHCELLPVEDHSNPQSQNSTDTNSNGAIADVVGTSASSPPAEKRARLITNQQQNQPQQQQQQSSSSDLLLRRRPEAKPVVFVLPPPEDDEDARKKKKSASASPGSSASATSSGIAGFPSLLNRHRQLLLRVTGVHNECDEFGQPIVSVQGEPVPVVVQQHGSANNSSSPGCAAAEERRRPPLQARKQLHVLLRDSWARETPPLRPGQLLRLIEPTTMKTMGRDENIFEVSDSAGQGKGSLLIVEPHTLISSTQLAQAHYCPRKAMFQDRFRASGSTLAMTVGTVAHELFQLALRKRPPNLSADWLFAQYRRRFLAPFCLDLVAMQCSLERFEEELRLYTGNIARWIQTHVPAAVNEEKPISCPTNSNSNNNKENNIKNRNIAAAIGTKRPFQTTAPKAKLPPKPMAQIRAAGETSQQPLFYARTTDIEENVWTPTIGVKGRIDVSFRGHGQPHGAADGGNDLPGLVMPLELKTGKSYGAGASIEHQSQVLLYTLMLAERANGGRVGPGFVLYMRDNSLAQVHPKTVPLRGLVQMRNRLATHFSRFTLDSFPEPLSNPRSCQYCPYTTLCGTIALGGERSGDGCGGANGNSRKREEEEEEKKKKKEPTPSSSEEEKEEERQQQQFDENADDSNKENIEEQEQMICSKQQDNKSPFKSSLSPPNSPPQRFADEPAPELLSGQMRDFLAQSTAHLDAAELAYARQWISLGLEEWGRAWERGSTVQLFSKSPVDREAHGTWMANLRLNGIRRNQQGIEDGDDNSEEPSFLLRFVQQQNSAMNKRRPAKAHAHCHRQYHQQFQPGSMVTVSTDREYALLVATVHAMDPFTQSIVLVSDKRLPLTVGNNGKEGESSTSPVLYHLDKHDGFTSHALSLGNLATLLENSPNAKRLRSVLTSGTACPSNEKEEVKEGQKADFLPDGWAQQVAPILDEMRGKRAETAKRVVREVLQTPDYALVRAASKESIAILLMTLARCLLQLGKSVLFCANSNAAVDELLILFKQQIPPEQMLRIGSRKSVPDSLVSLLLEEKLGAVPTRLGSDEEAKALFRRAEELTEKKLLVCCTVHSVSSHAYFASSSQRRFDFCLVIAEDASLALPDSLLAGPLLRSDHFVLFANDNDRHTRATKQPADVVGPNGLFARKRPPPLMDRLQQLLTTLSNERNGQKGQSSRRRRMFNLSQMLAEEVEKGNKNVEKNGTKSAEKSSGKKKQPKNADEKGKEATEVVELHDSVEFLEEISPINRAARREEKEELVEEKGKEEQQKEEKEKPPPPLPLAKTLPNGRANGGGAAAEDRRKRDGEKRRCQNGHAAAAGPPPATLFDFWKQQKTGEEEEKEAETSSPTTTITQKS